MFRRLTCITLILTFAVSLITPVSRANAQDLLGLPTPGGMVSLSPAYRPAMIKGVTVHKDNPFLFDFIVDAGQDKLEAEAFKKESQRLVNYFLASLAIGEEDLWVNLSPYEKDRIIPNALNQTEMGRDLLVQDYMLKQITASLIYPEEGLGRKFWDKVYAQMYKRYGGDSRHPDFLNKALTNVGTFNKVWIMADRAKVFERNNSAFVVDAHLKVMLEEDYLAAQQAGPVSNSSLLSSRHPSPRGVANQSASSPAAAGKSPKLLPPASMTSEIIRQVILPELEKEINEGKNFANLRQIFHSIILSSWYKKSLKNALLNQVYADKAIVKGIDTNDPALKAQIYERYLKAYKKGVFNFIKETQLSSGQSQPRKYFSGGVREGAASPAQLVVTTEIKDGSPAMAGIADNAMRVSVLASTEPRDEAMTTRQSPQDGLNNQHKHYIRMLGELTAKLRAGIFMNIVGFYNAHFSLFESEDETIRKKIIQALKNFNNTQISGLPEPTIDEPFTALLKRVDSALLSDDDRAKLRNLDASWTLDRITQEISIIETQINRLSLSISKAAADYKLVENVQRQELALRALNIDLLLLKQAKSALRALTVIVSDNNPMLRNNIWNAIKQVFSIGDLVIQSAQTSIREYLQNDINLASLLGQLGYFENGFVEVLSRSVDQSLEYGISFDKVLVVLKDWYESKDPQRNEELVINISIILEDRYQEADLKKSSEQVSRVFINKLGINVGDIIQSQLADAAMAEDKLLFPLTDPLVMKRVLSSAIGRKVDLKVMSEGIVFRGDAVVVKKFDTRKGTVTVTVPAIEQDQVYATDGNNNPRSLPLLMSVNDIYASQKLADVYTSTRQFDQLQPGQKVLIVTGQAIDIINGSYEGEFVRYDKALDDRSKGIIFIDVLGVEKEIRLNTFNYADVRKGPGKPLKLKPNAAMTSSFVELSPEMLAKARELNAIFFQGASYDYEVLRERVEVLWRELNNAKSDKGSQIKKDVLSMPFAEKEMIVMRETLTYFQNVLDQNKVNSFSFHVSSYGWSVKNSQRELFALFIKNIFHLDSSSVSNSAMTGKANGGIDLKTSQMTWDIEREGSGFGIEISAGGGSAFSGDQAQMARYLKEGIKSLTPRIIGVERISNLWAIFGMKG